MRSLCFVLLLSATVVLLSGCPPVTNDPDAGACVEGEVGCACAAASRCDGELICFQGMCQPCTADLPACAPGCQAGSEGCVCGPSETCGAGLTCQGGVCGQQTTCAPGAQGCLCAEGNQCDATLACVDGACQPCTGDTCPPVGCDGGNCQGRITCSSLPTACRTGETCIEATATEDAYCAAQVCPACTGTGVVEGPGIKLATGSCICETQPGFFFSEGGSRTAVPCDADGDGWVRSAARFYLNHSDPTLRENARCDLRVVNQFVLHNDLGQTLPVGLGVPLPLYESVRNDDAFVLQDATGTPQLPKYGDHRALRAEELNSLTKACVGEIADHNDNRVSDVAEWGRPPDQQVALGTSTDLEGEMRGYFEVYTRFSYFVELNRGWFTPGVGGSPGSYHIQEKDRTLSSGTNFPLRYGLESTEVPVPTSNYWQDCRRARDTWYSVEKPPIGLDFASLSDPNPVWKGMTHHSQFKCVQVVDDTRFATADREQNRHLQAVKTLGEPMDTPPQQQNCDGQANCVCRASADKCNIGLSCEASEFSAIGICRVARKDHLRAAINVCELTAEPGTALPGHGANPTDPSLSCQVSLPSTEHEQLGKVVWAAVRLTESSQYARGCILQCAGHPFICAGGANTTCRSMCGDFTANEPTPLGGGSQQLRLKGEVPFRAHTPETLQGQRFNIRAR